MTDEGGTGEDGEGGGGTVRGVEEGPKERGPEIGRLSSPISSSLWVAIKTEKHDDTRKDGKVVIG